MDKDYKEKAKESYERSKKIGIVLLIIGFMFIIYSLQHWNLAKPVDLSNINNLRNLPSLVNDVEYNRGIAMSLDFIGIMFIVISIFLLASKRLIQENLKRKYIEEYKEDLDIKLKESELRKLK